MKFNMWKWQSTIFYGLLFTSINYFLVCSAGYDYDTDDLKESAARCPWIRDQMKNGRVRIRSRGRIAKFTCKSGYELVGKRFATCIRGQWSNPIPLCIAKGCPRVSPPSNGYVTEMNDGAQLSFDCGPGYSLFGESTLYCDGKNWNTEPPTCQATTLQPKTWCDFEDPDLCGWTHGVSHHFDWKRHQFQTPSSHVGTGPTYDHTFGEGKAGHYMYIEASPPRHPNDNARLFSPVYSRHYSPGCFVFWYHMYGVHMGKLRVYFMPSTSIFEELTPLWEKEGNQGDQWFRGNITIPNVNENFQIVIEGLVGSSYISDAAIDDVRLLQTDCNSEDSTNSTESPAETENSCRGRCHEVKNSTSCGCTEACETTNTCCSDYSTLCTRASPSVKGEDESKESTTSGEMSQSFTRIEVTTPQENVGTEYSVTPEILYTEFIVTTDIVARQTAKSSEQSPTTVPPPETTERRLSTNTNSQTTREPIVISQAIPSSTESHSSVSEEQTSPSRERNECIDVTTKKSLITAITEASTTELSSTLSTTSTATSANTQPAIIQTSGSTTSSEVNSSEGAVSFISLVSDSKTTVRAPVFSTLSMSTTPPVLSTSIPISTSEPIVAFTSTSPPSVKITSNIIPSVKISVPEFTTSISTILHKVSPTMESKSIPTTLKNTEVRISSSITSTTPLTTSLKIISTTLPPVKLTTVNVQTSPKVTLKTLGALTTLPVTLSTRVVRTTAPVTSKIAAVTTSPLVTSRTREIRTTSMATSRTRVIRTTSSITSTTGFVKTAPPISLTSVLFPKRTTIKKVYPPFFKTTTPFKLSVSVTKIKNRTTQPAPYTTENQAAKKYTSESPVVHASKASADMHKGHGPNAIGISIGVVLLLGLVGAAVFLFMRRRSQMQSKLRDDSELRFLPDSEIIEYSDACALDGLMTSS